MTELETITVINVDRQFDRNDCVSFRGCLTAASKNPRAVCVCTPGCKRYVQKPRERANGDLHSAMWMCLEA